MSDLYQQVLLEELSNPQNKGKISDADVSYRALNASCGDDMTVFIKFDGDRTIEDIKWQGSGCAISQATMSLLSDKVKGKPLKEVLELQQQDLEKLIGVDSISSGRIKCLMLGLSAILKALAQSVADTKNSSSD